MPWFRIPAPILIGIAGTAYVAASLVLFVTETPLGSTLFFSMAAVMVAAYAAVLALESWFRRRGGFRKTARFCSSRSESPL